MFFRYVQREREEVIEEMDTVLLQERAGCVTLIPMDTRSVCLGSTALDIAVCDTAGVAGDPSHGGELMHQDQQSTAGFALGMRE